jgi:OmcA/MtrC family decaheme c-type cytochrome
MRLASLSRIARAASPLVALLVLGAGMAGCSGSDGKNGATGPTGPGSTVPGPTGPTGPTGPGLDPIASARPESCLTCHSTQGVTHQNVYRDYLDAKTKSKFKLSVNTLTAVPSATAGKYDVSLAFNVLKLDANGVNFIPYDDPGLGALQQKRFTVQGYFPGDPLFKFQGAYTTSLGTITSLGGGNYTASAKAVGYDPTLLVGWQAYGYIAAGVLETEGITLYADVADDGLAGGAAVTVPYASNASVEGCEDCHGKPYLKHGYRAAVVDGLTPFAACKECHYDDRKGGDFVFQQMVDQPFQWATGVAPDPVTYAYKASVMQDTHQSHAMEFPYPQSMANCYTCHRSQAKITAVTADSFFKAETCRSCHPVDGKDAWATQKYNQAGRAPALTELWAKTNTTFHDITDDCTVCHKQGGVAGQFSKYHSGYDAKIYNASKQRYADLPENKISIDAVTLTGSIVDVKFSATNTAIVPALNISFYGYDAKNMLVSSHTRDEGALTCYNDRAADPLNAPKVGCRYELAVDGNPVSTLQTNRLYTVMADSKPGAWHVQADLSKYVQPKATGLDTIPNLITAGKTKKAEIVVLPALKNAAGETVALNAATKTFDLVGKAFVADYFQGKNAVADVAKCNKCHDALGTTFHEGSYGGSVTLCRTCHVTTSGGAHLEMQSRGIDSYAHAIHRFQYFDTNGVDFKDPVFAKRYWAHINDGFPNFTIKNCEACHVTSSSTVPVTYNPPDNTKSLPGLESAAYSLTKGWVDLATGAPVAGPRNIGKVPALVTGPASRACGGCHKAVNINEDDEARLASFNSHMAMGGYNVENDSAGTYVYKMIDRIMTFFK